MGIEIDIFTTPHKVPLVLTHLANGQIGNCNVNKTSIEYREIHHNVKFYATFSV